MVEIDRWKSHLILSGVIAAVLLAGWLYFRGEPQHPVLASALGEKRAAVVRSVATKVARKAESDTEAPLAEPAATKEIPLPNPDIYYLAVKLPPEVILERWLATFGNPNATGPERVLLGQAIGDALRRMPLDAALMNHLATLLTGDELSSTGRQALMAILGDSNSPTSTAALLAAAGQIQEPDNRAALARAIQHLGRQMPEGRYPEELSDALLNAQRSLPEDLQPSIAQALANLGNARATQRLWETAFPQKLTVQQAENTEDVRIGIALEAMTSIRNPEGVPIIKRELSGYSPDNVALLQAGSVLSHMNHPDATAAILAWAVNAPEEAAPLVSDWLARIQNAASLDGLRATLRAEEFGSVAVRKAVEARLAK